MQKRPGPPVRPYEIVIAFSAALTLSKPYSVGYGAGGAASEKTALNRAEPAVKSRRVLNLLLAAALAVPAVPAMSVSSEAQVQLHEFLFGRNRPRRDRRVQEVPPAPQKIVRVSSPRYYTYKPAAMTTVSVAALLPATGGARVLSRASISRPTAFPRRCGLRRKPPSPWKRMSPPP
jgi:pimeloyl-ACP methyl ester carboxylesterase